MSIRARFGHRSHGSRRRSQVLSKI
jgi:hypothetical protein